MSRIFKGFPSICILTICLFCSYDVANAQSDGKPTGFMETTWGMTGDELKSLFPRQLEKAKEDGKVVYGTDYGVLLGKTFRIRYVMDDAGGLKEIRLNRPTRNLEKDTYSELFKLLNKQFDYISSTEREVGGVAMVIDTFLSKNSAINLVTARIYGKGYDIALYYKP